jgi:putative heme-binding domain-containing protein
VTYSGKLSDRPPEDAADRGVDLRRLRHLLEAGGAIDLAWSNLGHPDRAVRHAARLAVGRQPVERWRGRALTEGNPRALIAAVVALARREGRSAQAEIVEALGRLDWQALADQDRLDLLRAYELAACRSFPPDPATRERIVQQLDLRFPTHNDRLDRELAEVLTALEAPEVIPRTLTLLEDARTQEQQIHFAMCLRDLPRDWAVRDQKRYFGWFARAGDQRGGITFGEYVGQIRVDATRHLSARAKEELANLLRERPAKDPYLELKGRAFVRKWSVGELLPSVMRGEESGDRERGRVVFAAALCYRCHRFEGAGGMVGPDLTGVTRRFNARDLLEAVIEPSRVVSDQYRTSRIALKDGRLLTGKVKDLSGNTLVLMTNPLDPANLLMVARDGIEEIAWSGSSPMPEGLLDSFTKQDVLDLLEFLRSPILHGGTQRK